MVKILICDRVEIEKLALGPGIVVDYKPTISREELLQTVGQYDGLVVRSRTKVDREVLEKGTKLRLVARPGTGLDNVDVEFAKSRGITVVNSPESLVEAVAEHVILLMLAISRKLPAADASVKAHKWEKSSFEGRELKGKVLGIVGLGRIGRRIAEIARAMQMSVLFYDVIAIPEEVLTSLQARVVSLDELFHTSDYVTLHVPMTPETAHMVSQKRLAEMKPGAYLINTSRGGVIDEAALASALNEGKLAGAALDVFETEPPTGPILEAPNTILTPHIGGQTEEAQTDAISVVGQKVRTFFSTS
jgi:D-3-phosphoglycerate dehydrogenase / 2-oxoglutarate reductase